MSAHIGLVYDKAFEVMLSLTGSRRDSGRQMAHAMAHGYYGCRSYVIRFGEVSGLFSIISGD